MDLPKFLLENDALYTQYKRIIKNRAIYGPEVAYCGLHELTRAFAESYYMDLSTGSLRELAALWLSGAEPFSGQHGPDGIRNGRLIECKPRMFCGGNKRANGYGSINDHTENRHKRFIDDNLIMQQSQFFYGQCGWIIEFPYQDYEFVKHIEKQLKSAERNGGRICGRFTYKQWINSSELNIRFVNKKVIKENRCNIVGGPRENLLYGFLMDQ